jgi:hypothetical protein
MTQYRYPRRAPVENAGDAGFAALLGFNDGATFLTEYIDYIKFQEISVNYKGGGGLSSTTQTTYGTIGRDKANTVTGNSVYLYIPPDISVGYGINYNQTTMGVAGAAAVRAFSKNSTSDAVAEVQKAANAATPEAIYNLTATGIGAVSNAIGLSTDINARSLVAGATGLQFNPFQEQIFEGVSFREHTFNFKLVSRDEDDIKQIREILKFFKKNGLPSFSGGPPQTSGKTQADSKTSSSSTTSKDQSFAEQGAQTPFTDLDGVRYFTVPNRLRVEFIRVPVSNKSTSEIQDIGLYKFKDCIITNIGVSYTPDGQYVNTDYGMVPAVSLQLSLREVAVVTQEDIDKGF